MLINTSIYIKADLLIRLNDAASASGISLNRIISLLLVKVMDNKYSRPVLFEPVGYQRGDEFTRWHCLHISLRHDVYEAAGDLRKVRKLSVSFIIALAISEYLDKIIQEFSKKKINTDNYHHSYLFVANNYDGIQSYTIFWGIPPKQILKTMKI